MFKYLLIFIVVFNGCKKSEKNYEIANESVLSGLKNEVLSHTQERKKNVSELPDWSLDGSVKRRIEYSCNDQGECEILEVIEFAPNNVLLKKMAWIRVKYPEDPDYISISEINEDGFSTKIINENKTMNSLYERLLTYNDDNFVTEEIVNYKGELDSRTVYVYDLYNNIIKYSVFGKDNNLKGYTEYEYDNLNREIKHSYYKEINKIKKTTINVYKETDINKYEEKEYDEYGNLIETSIKYIDIDYMEYPEKTNLYPNIEYHSNGKISSWNYSLKSWETVHQAYNLSGKLIERTIFNSKSKRTLIFKYRIDGELIETIEKGTDRLTGRNYDKSTRYKLDFKGNVVEEYTIGTDGTELTKWEYEYY